ncbi:MAG: asparagine synthetase B, partial [Sphingomonas bacterium]|nr:asparagine synthetase B [Sphingomonas bacterium]
MERDVRRMTRAIAHRGPDDSGIWTDSDAGIALGHRRLSILDTSSCGHQPMTSPSGRYVMVYNGEAYNFAELRGTLEAGGVAPAWRGHSDTAILLAGFDHWGIPGTLKRTNGMFALAVWDRSERTLTL